MRRVRALFGYVYGRTFNTATGVVQCRMDTFLYDVPYNDKLLLHAAKDISSFWAAGSKQQLPLPIKRHTNMFLAARKLDEVTQSNYSAAAVRAQSMTATSNLLHRQYTLSAEIVT